jgi:hypothetical protein
MLLFKMNRPIKVWEADSVLYLGISELIQLTTLKKLYLLETITFDKTYVFRIRKLIFWRSCRSE